MLPSSDDEASENEDSPLIRPEGPELQDGKISIFLLSFPTPAFSDEERSVGWAAAFSRSSPRARGPSVSSYTSLDGEVNPVFAAGKQVFKGDSLMISENSTNTSTTLSSEIAVPIDDQGVPIIRESSASRIELQSFQICPWKQTRTMQTTNRLPETTIQRRYEEDAPPERIPTLSFPNCSLSKVPW